MHDTQVVARIESVGVGCADIRLYLAPEISVYSVYTSLSLSIGQAHKIYTRYVLSRQTAEAC